MQFIILITHLILAAASVNQNVFANHTDLFPPANVIEPWQYREDPKTYNDQTLYEYIDGAADLYIEFGFQLLITRELYWQDHSIMIEMYRMSDSTSSWGIFSSFKNPQSENLEDFKFAYSTPYSLSFVAGNYYVAIQSGESSEEIQSMMRKVGKSINSKMVTEAPPIDILFKCFPKTNMVPGSFGIAYGSLALNKVHFFSSENILKVSKDAPALFASYQDNKKPIRVMIISQKSTRTTKKIFENLKKVYGPNITETKIEGIPLYKVSREDDNYLIIKCAQGLYFIFNWVGSEESPGMLQELRGSGCCR